MKQLNLFILLSCLPLCARADESGPEQPARVQGTISAETDRAAILTVLPQGQKSTTDAVRIPTSVHTVVELAHTPLTVGDLKKGMWVQVESAKEIATNILAAHIWEEEHERLVLFRGLPEAFFTHRAGFELRNAATKFGPLSLIYHRTGNGAWLRFGRKSPPKDGVIMHWPATLKAKFYDGNTYQQPDEDGVLHWPGNVSEIRIWFEDAR